MNCTNDCPSLSREKLQQIYYLRTTRTVQTPTKKRKEHIFYTTPIIYKNARSFVYTATSISSRILFASRECAYVVGSSRNMTVGLLTNSNAMDSRFLWPPLNLSARVFMCSYSPRVVRISSIWNPAYFTHDSSMEMNGFVSIGRNRVAINQAIGQLFLLL